MISAWQFQQAMAALTMGGKGGKGKGKIGDKGGMNSNSASWGKWGAKGMKGAGKGWGAWQAWEDKPCGRCGGEHLARNCSTLTDGKTCNKCGRTGHTPAYCTSKKVIDDETCKGCGEKGHVRKECTQNLECSRCLKNGHVVKVCTHPAGYTPHDSPAAVTIANWVGNFRTDLRVCKRLAETSEVLQSGRRCSTSLSSQMCRAAFDIIPAAVAHSAAAVWRMQKV